MVSSDHEVTSDDDIDEARAMGENLIYQILDRKPMEVVKGLIDAGAPLWYQDDDGNSALHAAAYAENEELVKYLIEKGALWNAGTATHVFLSRTVAERGPPVDQLHNSAGDVALSMNNETIYTLIRDAGIRSGTLLRVNEVERNSK